jgi:SAM-dependent methyltransferase
LSRKIQRENKREGVRLQLALKDEADPVAPSAYGDNCAEFYDQIYQSVDPQMIDVLVELAREGPVLELGIGTGRVALPLLARGVKISGIEASAAMIAKLRAKPRSSDLRITQGNFADLILPGCFNLIFSLVSTFFLLSSAEQQKCFYSVTEMLGETGLLLLENFSPAGTSANHRPQWFKQLVGTNEGIREYIAHVTYASPRNLDEMALCAGLKLRERWGDWSKKPYTSQDAMHISIYQRFKSTFTV